MLKKSVWILAPIALLVCLCCSTAIGQLGDEPAGIAGAERPSAHQKKSKYECRAFSKYVVFTTPTEDGVGEDIRVSLRQPNATLNQSCNINTAKTLMMIANDDSNFFFGLFGDYLFVDVGTGPEPRELRIYDLAKKKKIYTDSYAQPVKISSGPSLDFYRALENNLPKRDCPQAKKWEAGGLGYGFEQRVILDLTTLKAKPVGKPRCSPRQ